MQEAFRRAARKIPKNPVSRDVFKASDQIRQESLDRRHEQELEELKREFTNIGSD